MGLVAAGLGWGWILIPLTYGFLARVACGPRFSPLGLIATKVVAPQLPQFEKLVPGPPKRFAQALGVAFTVTASALWLAGAPGAARVVLGEEALHVAFVRRHVRTHGDARQQWRRIMKTEMQKFIFTGFVCSMRLFTPALVFQNRKGLSVQGLTQSHAASPAASRRRRRRQRSRAPRLRSPCPPQCAASWRCRPSQGLSSPPRPPPP